MKSALLKILFLVSFLVYHCTGCQVRRYPANNGEKVVETEWKWGIMSGWRGTTASRSAVVTKTYNPNGVLIKYTLHKNYLTGCTGDITFYEMIKVYSPKGKLSSLSINTNYWNRKNKSVYRVY